MSPSYLFEVVVTPAESLVHRLASRSLGCLDEYFDALELDALSQGYHQTRFGSEFVKIQMRSVEVEVPRLTCQLHGLC